MATRSLESAFAKDLAVVILCGGQGTRMGSAQQHKVCFPIDGRPAINRTVGMFEELGVGKIVLVVGALTGQVVSTVGMEFPHVVFAYQHQQLGTGNAALVGTAALERLGHPGPVLLTMGDKVIESTVVLGLCQRFVRSRCDLIFVTASKRGTGALGAAAGRVVTDGRGRILCDIEMRDIQRIRVMAQLNRLLKKPGKLWRRGVPAEQIIKVGRRYISDQNKLFAALGPVAEHVAAGRNVAVDSLRALLGPHPGTVELSGRHFTADQIERHSKTVNLSIYLARSALMYQFVPKIQPDNAQGEYYFTDIIKLLADDVQNWKLQQLTVSNPTDVMAFNSPDELLEVEDALRRRKLLGRKATVKSIEKPPTARMSLRQCKPAETWLELFESWAPKLRNKLADIYGPDQGILGKRRALFIKAIKLFIKRFGPRRKAVIVRAPGRLNLMGRHVDHRGGAVNVMAIDREIVFVAAARNDDQVRLVNVDSRRFAEREFSISELLGSMRWDDWLSYVNSQHVREILLRSQGDWSNYIKASLLRLQQGYHQVRILGMDAAVAGDVPTAAGLSSSSALVVASAEAAVAFNALDVTPSELVDFCGEGEWFVGSRGVAGEHAAISLGKRGSIAHVRFFPFNVAGLCSLPDNCQILIADSGQATDHSASATDHFDQTMASYELGFMLLKDRLVQYDHLLEHLRDVNVQRLNCSISDIYRMLLQIPEQISRQELVEMLSGRHRQRLEELFDSHKPCESYKLRGLLLYGIAECQRSLMCPDILQSGDLELFGKLMNISHDGDRVCRYKAAGETARGPKRSAYMYDASNLAIGGLCDSLASEDPQRVLDAQLYMQAGGYRCSTDQIDKMVDIALSVPGVYGAQLAGAGLGGCIMVLAMPRAMKDLQKVLKRDYYQGAKLTANMHLCQPVEGSGLLSV